MPRHRPAMTDDSRNHPMTYPVVAALLITAGLLLAPLVSALELTPYSARYTTTTMGLDMTLERELSRQGEYYTLSSEGSVFLASLTEKARFTVVNDRVHGQDFSYQLKGLVNRRREVLFQPEDGVICSLRKKEWTEHPWHPDILDRLSQQEQLRLDLMRASEPPQDLTFRVIDGPRVRERTLKLVGREVLDTGLGSLDTLHYRRVFDEDSDRSSDIWVAPELDYLMVKTVHLEGNTRIEIHLLDTSLAGD